jgi:hypothetical protein
MVVQIIGITPISDNIGKKNAGIYLDPAQTEHKI